MLYLLHCKLVGALDYSAFYTALENLSSERVGDSRWKFVAYSTNAFAMREFLRGFVGPDDLIQVIEFGPS